MKILIKILTSNWIAYPAVILSASCIALLFFKGKTIPATILSFLLLISMLLIILGQRGARGDKRSE